MVNFCLIPFIWGLSEATFFFIVPDVWLTGLVFTQAKTQECLKAVAWALAGALLGGIIMYWAGRLVTYEMITGCLAHVPAINQSLIKMVAQQVGHDGPWSVFEGVIKAIPYKIYAVEWGSQGGSLGVWIFASVAARGGRFILSVILAKIINASGQKLFKNWDSSIKWFVFFAFWITFYIFYFMYRIVLAK